jgi:hypothetical protein
VSPVAAQVTTADVVRRIIVPETQKFASSYAAHFSALAFGGSNAASTASTAVGTSTTTNTPTATAPDNGVPIALRPTGRVDFFVSHAWAYPFHHLVSAIRTHHKRLLASDSDGKRSGGDHGSGDKVGGGDGDVDGAGTSRADDGGKLQEDQGRDDVYYWLDVFAVNQHNVHSAAELPKLQNAITASRGMVVVLAPWEKPIALTRIWCLYEILTAMNTGTPVAVQMPPDQQDAFTAELARDFSAIRLRLCEIDSVNAHATQPADLRQIRKQIESTVGCVTRCCLFALAMRFSSALSCSSLQSRVSSLALSC